MDKPIDPYLLEIDGEIYGVSSATDADRESIEAVGEPVEIDPEGWRMYADVIDAAQIEWLKKHPEHDWSGVLERLENKAPRPRNRNKNMKFFLDTADIAEIREAQETGLLDGITTNPSHVAKSNRNFIELVKEICEIVPGPVSAEVTAEGKDEMLRQGRFLANLASNVVVKVPLTQEGLKAVNVFTQEGIKTNVTLCFSPVQALLAAKVGATYISPFVGRIDDLGNEGLEVIRSIRAIYDNYQFATQILTASTRSALHIQEAAIAGSDVATMPFVLFKKLVSNPLTDIGLKMFETDWNKIPEANRTY